MKQSLYKMILTVISGVFLLGSLSVQAADIKPAVIYDMGGKFDKSFNEGVWNGVKKFTEETGIKVMEFEVTNETQREQAMRQMVDRGATIVLGLALHRQMLLLPLPRKIRMFSFQSLMCSGLMHQIYANMPLKSMKAAIW